MRSCLKLFSRLFEVPEAEVRGYLDMYFQLRLRVEENGGRQIAAPTEKAAVDAVGADIIRPRTLDEDGGRQVQLLPAAPTGQARPRGKSEIRAPAPAPHAGVFLWL